MPFSNSCVSVDVLADVLILSIRYDFILVKQ